MKRNYTPRLSAWINSTRPKTLLVSICPILLSTSLSQQKDILSLPIIIIALLASILIQIGCNLANDYFDFKKQSDRADRKGPKRALQSGILSENSIKNAFITCLAIALLLSAYLMMIGGWPIILIGLSAVACAVLYTATPYALAYTGFSDLAAFSYFGPIAVAGTLYCQNLTWHTDAIIWGTGLGLYAVAILTVNNLRDIKEDALSQKKTLAVRFGASFARTEYTLCTILPLSAVLFWTLSNKPQSYLLAWAPLFIISISNINNVTKRSGKELEPYLGKTALCLLLFTITSSILIQL